MPTHYKIGTRGSLLALTQCGQVKEQLEALTGDTFELVVIKTQGDMIQHAPLWQLDGKDFFSKELDEALISGEVDLVVHSYKDLGSVRPEEIQLAAVTKRSFAHDILLIKKETIPTIRTRTELLVGTSSPRRIVNIEKKLADYLPHGKNLIVKTKMLRGNVNSRIQKLRDGQYDAIVLALPGIERLALTPDSREELTKLLQGINFMVLPQSDFPSAASQGALGIECRKNRDDNGALLEKLSRLEDVNTRQEVYREREACNKYGGGCHLAVGINVKKLTGTKENLFLHSHQGEHENKKVELYALEGRTLPVFVSPPKAFNASPQNDKLITKTNIPVTLDKGLNLYVTSRYCLDAVMNSNPETVWAAGTRTWKDLANLGFWVNGTSDGTGDEEMRVLRSAECISLMKDTKGPLIVLSNDEAKSSLTEHPIIACYKRVINPITPEEFKKEVRSAEVFYWTSFYQYQNYINHFPEIQDRFHCCGLGKTYDHFIEHNIPVIPMAGSEEFNQWVNHKN